MPDFECRLKKYRQLKELTQEQLAQQVGVRRETIMRLEKAQYNPSLKLAVTYPGRWRPLLRIFLSSREQERPPGCGPGVLRIKGGEPERCRSGSKKDGG